ncbi:MAG: energy transducer TonB [Prevotellaceae bacterium]|jgi:TonB family protein|nr:energy transducer TonB [Prevotellaceae bacterium]
MKILKPILICAGFVFALNGYAQGHLEVVLPESETSEENAMIVNDADSNDDVFISVDRAPRYPLGEEQLWKFISDHLQYPEEAIGRGISGQVGVKFIVRKSGQITDVQVSRSVHPLLDEEAVRVIKSMPKWIPADFRGQAVSTPYELFIYFKGVK